MVNDVLSDGEFYFELALDFLHKLALDAIAGPRFFDLSISLIIGSPNEIAARFPYFDFHTSSLATSAPSLRVNAEVFAPHTTSVIRSTLHIQVQALTHTSWHTLAKPRCRRKGGVVSSSQSSKGCPGVSITDP
jgi:hypothetical protein